jgi:hypothetical protein
MNASMQSIDTKTRLAARRVAVFNVRFRPGAAVMYIPGVGEEPKWDRVYSPAWVQAGRSVVHLAGRECPVDTDACYSPPAEAAPVRCMEPRLRVWQVVLAFVLGMAASVLLALAVPPAKAVAPEHIVIECDEPGESLAEEGQAAA